MIVNEYYFIIKKDKLLFNNYFDFSKAYKLEEISKYGMIFEGHTDIAFPLDESYYIHILNISKAKVGDLVRQLGRTDSNYVLLVEWNEFAGSGDSDGAICYGLDNGDYIIEDDIIEVNSTKI